MALEVLKHDMPPWLRPLVSIVIPLLNEGDNVQPLYRGLRAAMEQGDWTWEVIFVDDGSTDTTFKLLEELHKQDDHVRVLRLRRNFGQTAALAAGFDAARGARIVRHCPAGGKIGRRLRCRKRLACTPEGEFLATPAAVTAGELANQPDDGSSPP
jgi:cellulose synthase/poly-beta-1,6-N-acetylglucosamine synthase-like glycosyltransferase